MLYNGGMGMSKPKIQYLIYVDDGSELTGHSILDHYPLNSMVEGKLLPYGSGYSITGIKAEFLTESELEEDSGISFPRKLSYTVRHLRSGHTIRDVAPDQITLVEESKVDHWPLGAMVIQKYLGEYAESQELVELTCQPMSRDEDVKVRCTIHNVSLDGPEFITRSANQLKLAGKYPNAAK